MSDRGAIIELTVDRAAHGGTTVGRHEGKTIFVAFALPGERVRARITFDKKRFAFAEVVEVLDASPERVQPMCKHFGVCGGCRWQHAAYPLQLDMKRGVVIEQLARSAHLPDVIVHPTLGAESPYGYRVHATLHGSAAGTLGFVGMNERNVIAIDECPILRPDLEEAFQHFKQQRMAFPAGMRVRLQVGDEGEPTSSIIHSNPDPDAPDDDDLMVTQTAQAVTPVFYTVMGRRFRCSAGAFFQVNPPQAAVLIEQALARLNLMGVETVLDLYSGGGLFSAFVAYAAKQVIAVELAPLAVADARVNLADVPNVEIYSGEVETLLPMLAQSFRFDAVLLDPPRSGMKPQALEALIACAPRRIAYVSCDPATLARDARRLVDAGYRLIDVQPVDMFPQTFHIECVAGFEK